jgi:hypothetical protein
MVIKTVFVLFKDTSECRRKLPVLSLSTDVLRKQRHGEFSSAKLLQPTDMHCRKKEDSFLTKLAKA